MLVLTSTAKEMLESYLSEDIVCTCISCPPCSYCTDLTSPAILLEDEEYWTEMPIGDDVGNHYTRKDLEEML